VIRGDTSPTHPPFPRVPSGPTTSPKSRQSTMFHKVRDIVRAQGLPALTRRSIAYAYRRGVRPYLPSREPVRYAGVPICYDRKLGDHLVPTSWVPEEVTDEPGYEATLIALLIETIRPGDSVVVIGGGLGVTAVVAALRAGPSGTVQCFEGSKQHVRLAQQTATRNRLFNIRIHHAVVAKSDRISTSATQPDD
jgi:hypothetical protein